MLEFKPISGIKVTAQDLKPICETPLTHLRRLAQRVVSAVDGRGAYIFGGALRNYVWKILGKKLPPRKVDIDVIVTTDMAIDKVITAVSGMREFSPLLIVATDTIRAVLNDNTHVDFKFAPAVRFATLDFTINAVVAPLEDIFGRGAYIYCVSLDDLDNKILRHISPFDLFPFHMLRGVRLASTYGLKFAPATLQEYQRKAKRIKDVSPPLIHRELAAAVQEGYEYAVWAVAATAIILHLFPSLMNYAKKNPDGYKSLVATAHRIISLFNPSGGDDEVKKLAPQRLLEKQFAPGGRNLLYCYFLASLLLPFSVDEKLLTEMNALNLYPAERGVISLCLNYAKSNIKLEQVHPLARPFVLAYRKAKGER